MENRFYVHMPRNIQRLSAINDEFYNTEYVVWLERILQRLIQLMFDNQITNKAQLNTLYDGSGFREEDHMEIYEADQTARGRENSIVLATDPDSFIDLALQYYNTVFNHCLLMTMRVIESVDYLLDGSDDLLVVEVVIDYDGSNVVLTLETR